MNEKKVDLFIKNELQKDKNIDKETKEIFKNFEEDLKIKNNKNESKIIKISFNAFVAVAASFVVIAFVGVNMHAKSIGKPNAISALQALFSNEKKVERQEEQNEEINKDENIENPKEGINKISKDEAFSIIKDKYASNIIKISIIEKNITQDNIEYYAFKKEQINADGTEKYLSTILITLDGETSKEIYDPDGTKTEEKNFTEEQRKEIEEDKYNEQAKNAINKYFELRLQSSPDELLLKLGLLNNLEELQVNQEEKILDEQYHLYYKKTNIKYSTFKNKMLEYMTENMFNQFIYNHIESWYKNVDEMLWVADYRAEGTDYYVEDLELISINGNVYEYFVKYRERGDSVIAVRTIYLEIVNNKVRIDNTDM